MTRQDQHRVRSLLRTLQNVRRRGWWIALGDGDAHGLRLGGHPRPWHHPDEYTTWQTWSRGQSDRRAVIQLLQRWPDNDWLVCLPTAFLGDIDTGSLPTHWTNPALSPNLARLRWTMRWLWDAARQRWIHPQNGDAWPTIPGFSAWAAVLPTGVPQNLTQWYLAGEPRYLSDSTPLPVPWLWAVLTQTLLLQAIGAGYWDWAEASGDAWFLLASDDPTPRAAIQDLER